MEKHMETKILHVPESMLSETVEHQKRFGWTVQETRASFAEAAGAETHERDDANTDAIVEVLFQRDPEMTHHAEIRHLEHEYIHYMHLLAQIRITEQKIHQKQADRQHRSQKHQFAKNLLHAIVIPASLMLIFLPMLIPLLLSDSNESVAPDQKTTIVQILCICAGTFGILYELILRKEHQRIILKKIKIPLFFSNQGYAYRNRVRHYEVESRHIQDQISQIKHELERIETSLQDLHTPPMHTDTDDAP